MQHVFLVDGSGFIFRAFHALPPMARKDGTPVNAVYGFCSMLMKLLEDTDADHIAVVFDTSRKTFRTAIYPDYKAHRPPPPEELIPQFALIRDAVRAFNLPCIELDGYEADDLIATYAKQAAAKGAEVTIVSSDKDLMQLIDDRISMLDPMKLQTLSYAAVEAKFGVPPDKVVDVQALAGDSTDNVPGVPGIGVKTASQLILEYGDLETLLAQADGIKQKKRRENLIEFADQARVSQQLVRLAQDAPVPEPLESFTVKQPDADTLLAFLEAQSFKSLTARVEANLAADGNLRTTPEDAAPAETDYELVTSREALDRWVAAAWEAGVLAIDTETNSLDALRADLVGISLAVEPGKACYIPIAHRNGAAGELELDGGDSVPNLPLAEAVAALKDILLDASVLKIGQNIKYDMEVLARHGLSIATADDTMVLSYVLDGGQHGHGMDELAELFLGLKTIKYEEVCGKGKDAITFDRVPLDQALAYAAEDADVTLKLWRKLKPRLPQEHMVRVYEELDRPLVPVLADMEAAGVLVDRDGLKALSADFADRLQVLEGEIHTLAGRNFTIGSPKQLGEILFDEMSLPGGKKTGKSGAWATGADVLEDLAAQGHDLPARVLDWRQLSKLKSTYTDALVEQINPETGRIHTSLAQTVVNTGRLSSSDPNLQNIPVRTEEGRKIRETFIAAPGTVLMSADYSQIELRLLAHVGRIESLRQAFLDGLDIHAVTASEVFGIPLEGMDPAERRKAKAINFGIIYGISAFGLARNIRVPQGEAKAFIDAYFQRYPGIRDYMTKAKAFAGEHGYVTTIFGRKCHTPGIKDKNPARRSFQERVAINAPLQGSAADIIKRAMIRLPDALAEAGLGAKMLLQVHDELLFEVPEAEVNQTKDVVLETMQTAASLSVPLVVEAGVAKTWAAAH
ncbi:MAG: DNA polymerase I [Alphaproteobacteria bacterium]|nr:DNA polymerase I [Alphaproteobacteria bacterium]